MPSSSGVRSDTSIPECQWYPSTRTLVLPEDSPAWDLLLAGQEPSPWLVNPGTYKLPRGCEPSVRRSTDTRWIKPRPSSKGCAGPNSSPLKTPDVNDTSVMVGLTTPDTHYLADEDLLLQFLPPDGGHYELELRGPNGTQYIRLQQPNWRASSGLPVGSYAVRGRWAPSPSAGPVRWTAWTPAWTLRVHPHNSLPAIEQLRVHAHRLSMMMDRDVAGIRTLTDPFALPPACPEDGAVWFRTPCYEGSTMLVDEPRDYYLDPLAYLLESIDILRGRGARFINWHDVLDGRDGRAETEVLLQFDVDAGPLSMARIADALRERGICATAMIHREAHDWYSYRVEEVGIDWLRELEASGWTIGYHNNALGNTQRMTRSGDYSASILDSARQCLAQDVTVLRSWFDIRTLTHHGGNVLNKRTPIPDQVGIVCVDRAFSPDLWRRIRGAFSDGGFVSRPTSLRERVRTIGDGLFFFRLHPVKYGNYQAPFDVPPLLESDVRRLAEGDAERLIQDCRVHRTKQDRWLELRNQLRLGKRLTSASAHKPVSSRFHDFAQVRARVKTFRTRRRPRLLREYPWILGDPRVFWWRMLDAFAPRSGRVLNVGALPAGKKDETTAFLHSDVKVEEMDVDPKRKPTWVCDVTAPPAELLESFDGVFLFGLPCFHSPGRAVSACFELTCPGGVGLFGFAADTHPTRGALWRPWLHPAWRSELEPLTKPGESLQPRSWSFEEECLDNLLGVWPERKLEFFHHYWFAVCRKAG